MELEHKDIKTPAVKGKINTSNLKQNQYTILLLNEALRAGLVNGREISRIQAQIMLILKDLIMKYTNGESSSVTTDTAESLLNSILYCIDAYTLSCKNPEEAICNLQTMKLENIYQKGVEHVTQWFEDAKKLYKEVRADKLKVQLESYNLTINEDIPLFLEKYGMVFNSHDTMAGMDYPLVFDDMNVRGVLYIKNYLEHLKIETEFCRYFPIQGIEKLLSCFGKMTRTDYRIELINIFELVFNNAFFSSLSGSTVNDLSVPEYHFEMLNKRLKASSPDRINADMGQTIERLTGALNISKPEIIDYIQRYKPLFAQRVINAVKNDTLRSMIITEKEEPAGKNLLVFEEGERMSDADFRSLAGKLTKLRKKEDKVNLIKTSIGSLYDFVDILDSDCLFGDEFEALFSTLGSMELAVLAKMVFFEELRDGFLSLSSIISQKKQEDSEWKMHFAEFLQKSGEGRIKLIENRLHQLN